MKKFIYQDPGRPRVKSRPIDADDVQSRKVLEGGGWRIIETIDDEAVSVETTGPGDDAVSAAAQDVAGQEGTPAAEAPEGESALAAEPKKRKGGKAPAAGA